MINSDSESMSKLDRAWMRMEHPSNLMIITVVLTTKTPIQYERFKSVLMERLSMFKRLQQCATNGRWVDDKFFNYEDHIFNTELYDSNSEQELMSLVGQQMSQPLNFNRPLWQIEIINHYQQGSAIIIRLHHCIGDGIAIVNILLGMTDPQDDKPEYLPEFRTNYSAITKWDSAKDFIHSSKNNIVSSARKIYDNSSHLSDLGDKGLKFVRAWNKLAFIQNDSPSPLKGKLGKSKRAAWSHQYNLMEIKQAGKRHNATINDVMLSAISGAINHYLEEKGITDSDLRINFISPVNFKPVRDLTELGNQFGLVFLALPVNESDPIKRLLETHKRMKDIKHSPEAAISKGYISTLGSLIKATQNYAIDSFCARATGIFTNVTGPTQHLSLDGAEIDRAMFWVPKTGRLGLGVSVMSYRDKICLAIASDHGLIPDPERLIELFHKEIEVLIALSD